MKCIYGNKYITNNITNVIKEQFMAENIINIPKNTKLNNYVNYVNLSEPNILKITINNKNISINENDIQKHDIIIDNDGNINYNQNKIENNNIMNICHFVFGLKKQTEELLFSYYIAVYSAYLINNPDVIYFYYHYEPYGIWWEKLKLISSVKLEKISIPTHIGKKKIIKTAHKADWVRMNILYEKGGIYLDIDTICVRPWKHLLDNQVVLGLEPPNYICNAIMFTKPKSEFFKIWLLNYEEAFNPDGWKEASILLPRTLSHNFSHLITLKEADTFFLPTWYETEKIFVNKNEIPSNIISLHLWESMSMKYLKDITDWSWANQNSHTMYGKMLLNLQKNEIMSINETSIHKHNNININKTIYMTYYKNIPEKVKTQWIKYNTDYKIDFSLDKDCLNFLKKNFNTYISDLFNNINEGMYKADLWRLCKLFKHSGVYADVDLVPYLNIDKLDKNIIFYSCLSIDINSIFQALIINFSKPNHPLFFVLLLSFLINKLYKYHNGPTYDMYYCIKYMLNVNTILPEKKYEVDFLKLKICIGSSTNNIKKINLYYFPDNINYTIQLHKNLYKDTFNFKIVNNYLIVERIDLLDGWNHNHYIDICFPYKCSFFFFKEETMNHWSKAYVTHQNIKILKSKDIDYYKNKGW